MSWFFNLTTTDGGRVMFLTLLVIFACACGPAALAAGIWLERWRNKFVTADACKAIENQRAQCLRDLSDDVKEQLKLSDLKVHSGLQEIRGDVSRVFDRVEDVSQKVGVLTGRVDEMSKRQEVAHV